MQLLDVSKTGTRYQYLWPSGDTETYDHWIEYRAASITGEHSVRIGFGTRETYGASRKRVVVWVDGHPHAEFVGADDFEASGDVLAEIKVPGDTGERMCRYLKEAVPERYSALPIAGMRTRVQAKGVHDAWAVVANFSDHRTLAALAALRRLERDR